MEAFFYFMGCVFTTLIISGVFTCIVIALTPATKRKEEVTPPEKGKCNVTIQKGQFNWMPTNNN
jgi:hypothetical protein